MKAHYYNRFGKRWNINECIQLQREFELLELSINEIAKRHQRSPCAIMSRLAYEGFADYNVLYSNYYNLLKNNYKVDYYSADGTVYNTVHDITKFLMDDSAGELDVHWSSNKLSTIKYFWN